MDLSPQSSNQEGENASEKPNIVILQHPSGSKIYIVATAHISQSSQTDVEETIENVGPAYTVLEIDPERMKRLLDAANLGDKFGLERYKSTSTPKIIKMAFTGDLITYASGLLYVCTGALMGTRPGGEFLKAAEASERVGAQIIYGDRSQDVTMRRLQWYTRKLMEVERGGPPGRIEWPTQTELERQHEVRGGGPSFARPDSFPTTGTSSGPSPLAVQAKADVEAAVGGQNPWGLQDNDNSESAIKARLLRMMREGGCPQPNVVLEAAQRLLKSGVDPKGKINPADVLAVRECGSTLIETLRTRAFQGEDSWMKEFEIESLTGAKGALGAQRSGMAMRKVIIDERDFILARRLYEAGEMAAGQPVVGVCGAGHVRGIQKYWNAVASPEAAVKVQEYSSLPPGEGPPSVVGIAITGGVLGYLSYKRPKAAAIFAGAVVLTSAPYLGFSAYTVKRLTTFAEKLTKACESIDMGDVGIATEAGWGGESDSWQ